MRHFFCIAVLVGGVSVAGCGAGQSDVSSVPVEAPKLTKRGTPSSPAQKVMIVNQPGMVVAMDDVLVPDCVTVVEFYADWCGACKVIEKKLMAVIDREPRIVLRKINIKDDTSPVAKAYDVGLLPHLRIFDSKGKLAYVLVGNNATKAGQLAIEVLARK